jgi:hypothetical protein
LCANGNRRATLRRLGGRGSWRQGWRRGGGEDPWLCGTGFGRVCYGREVVWIEIRAGTEPVKIWCGAEWMRFVELSSTWSLRLVRMRCYLGLRGSPFGSAAPCHGRPWVVCMKRPAGRQALYRTPNERKSHDGDVVGLPPDHRSSPAPRTVLSVIGSFDWDDPMTMFRCPDPELVAATV